MSLALFRSTLRSAVREAQAHEAAAATPPADPRQTPPQAELLLRLARGEISIEDALVALGDRP